MLKLITMAAPGYAAFRYLQTRRDAGIGADKLRIAGGGLSAHATVQSDPDTPPAFDPYRQ